MVRICDFERRESRNSPWLFSFSWEQRQFEKTFSLLQNNTLSRAELSASAGVAANIHYGDVLIKFGEYLDMRKETFPWIEKQTDADKFRTSFLQDGDVVFADTAEDETAGKCCEIRNCGSMVIISGLHTIPCRPESKFASGYLGYYLNSTAFHEQLVPLMQGTKVVSISKAALKSTFVRYPSDDKEQQKIGTFFRKLDDLLALHQCKYFYASSKSGFFHNEKTNVWEQRKVNEIATEITRTDSESTAPVMMISAASGFIYQSEKYAFDNAGQSLQKYIVLKKGELAYNHGASKQKRYGSCFSLLLDEARVPFVYHCFEVGQNNPDFIAIELNSTKIDVQLRRLVSSGCRMDGLLNISYDDYATVEIPIPQRSEQDKISLVFSNLDRLIALHQREYLLF